LSHSSPERHEGRSLTKSRRAPNGGELRHRKRVPFGNGLSRLEIIGHLKIAVA
jgi:hypothetical protein